MTSAKKNSWIDFGKNFAGTIIAILGAMFWVNTQIVELKTQMKNVEASNYKSELKELKDDFAKQLEQLKSEQRDRDRSQWESIGRKKDK